ncbi:MAG: hypothetical protein ABSC61_04095 [Anaerolineales bacterium]
MHTANNSETRRLFHIAFLYGLLVIAADTLECMASMDPGANGRKGFSIGGEV